MKSWLEKHLSRGFTGNIGRQLKTYDSFPIIDFQRIDAEEPTVDCGDYFSTNEKYLFDIHQAITNGYYSPDLVHHSPVKMAHSRWLTTANRLLRIYISTVCPSENLMNIASFIMKVYTPMSFSIKQSTSFINGSKHVFKTIELTKILNDEVKDIVNPVIQRNVFFSNPENILASMIHDDRSAIRELAWRRMKKVR